jgi:hypothetical protein
VFIVGLFYWLNYVDKNVTISGTLYFQDYQKNILKEYLSRKERAKQCKICRVSLREGKKIF